jgi:hypothetical protein
MTEQLNSQITIRLLGEQDSDQLRRLAERDSAVLPQTQMLGAERNGRLIAAMTLTGSERTLIADPFEVTTDATALLRMRVEQIDGADSDHRDHHHHRLGGLRRPRRAHAALAGSPPGSSRLLQL